MNIYESALFIINADKIYPTENLMIFIWGVYLAICLVTLIGSLLPKIIGLTSRFGRWVISKINKRKEK